MLTVGAGSTGPFLARPPSPSMTPPCSINAAFLAAASAEPQGTHTAVAAPIPSSDEPRAPAGPSVTRTFGMPRRSTATVLHMSSPAVSLAFSSRVSSRTSLSTSCPSAVITEPYARPVQVFTTTPFDDIAAAGELFATLERIGYDGAFSYETKHDPFLPLALAADRTTTLRLGTAIAIAFARTPMTIANVGYDLQEISGGRFTLGLGSQIRPHIQNRYSMPWSRPAARMREFVLAVRAIWEAWDTGGPLRFEGEFYRHTLMTPAFAPGPHRYGPARIHVAGVGPAMTRVAAEVGDGIIVHPFNTRASLEELTLPALAGRGDGFEI